MSNYIHIINKKSSNNLKQHNIQTSVVMMIQRNVYFWFPSLLNPFHSQFRMFSPLTINYFRQFCHFLSKSVLKQRKVKTYFIYSKITKIDEIH